MSINLLEETHKLLARCDLTQKEIADQAGVNYWWFIKFAQRNTKSPVLAPVQKLYDFLVQREEEIKAIASNG